MTDEEALQFLDCYDTLWSQFEEPTRTRARDAVEAAISALRERIERNNVTTTNADYIRSFNVHKMAQNRIRKIYFYNGKTVWVGDFGEAPNLGEAYKAEIEWLEQPWEGKP